MRPRKAIERWLWAMRIGVEWVDLSRVDAMGYRSERDAYGHVVRWAKPWRRWRGCSVAIREGNNEGYIVEVSRGPWVAMRVKTLGSKWDALRLVSVLACAFM